MLGRRHLPLLDRRDLLMREQDEDVGPLAAAEGVDRSAARVTRRRADDRGALAAIGQGMVHQSGEQLHRHILEGERGAVKQFEDKGIGAALDHRCHGGMLEGRVGSVDHRLEVGYIDVLAGKGRQHCERHFLVALAAQRPDLLLGEMRPFLRHIEAPVTGQARQKSVGKAQFRGFAPRRNIAHVNPSNSSLQPAPVLPA